MLEKNPKMIKELEEDLAELDKDVPTPIKQKKSRHMIVNLKNSQKSI